MIFFWLFLAFLKGFLPYKQPFIFFSFRHLYKPLVKRGYSKLNASVAVFCLSAFFHEVRKWAKSFYHLFCANLCKTFKVCSDFMQYLYQFPIYLSLNSVPHFTSAVIKSISLYIIVIDKHVHVNCILSVIVYTDRG